MTYQVLTRHGVGSVAASLIAWGAMLPDVEDCLAHGYCDYAPAFCQPDSAQAVPFASDHFDNNLLEESLDRVNDRMAAARAGIISTPTDSRAFAKALVAFGEALHTTQDFYAHSTFVEINIFPYSPSFDLANAPLWHGEPYSLYSWQHGGLFGDGSLQTGYYLQGAPAGGYTHARLNKDSPGSSEGGRTVNITGHGISTLYAAVSGDFGGDLSFGDEGLAPRHTLYAYQQLLNGGDVFPYVSGTNGPARATRPDMARRVLEFFSWVEQDSLCRVLAEAADSIMARASGDSIGSFDPGQVDADGLPVPSATVGVPVGRLRATPSSTPVRERRRSVGDRASRKEPDQHGEEGVRNERGRNRRQARTERQAEHAPAHEREEHEEHREPQPEREQQRLQERVPPHEEQVGERPGRDPAELQQHAVREVEGAAEELLRERDRQRLGQGHEPRQVSVDHDDRDEQRSHESSGDGLRDLVRGESSSHGRLLSGRCPGSRPCAGRRGRASAPRRILGFGTVAGRFARVAGARSARRGPGRGTSPGRPRRPLASPLPAS